MPELLGPVRADRGEHGHDRVRHGEAERRVAPLERHVVHVLGRRVGDLHDGGDGGVELAAVEVGGALDAHAVERAPELLAGGVEGARAHGAGGRALAEQPDHAPRALDEAVGAGDGLLVPVEVLLGRGDEEDGQTHGVRAVGLDYR